MEIEAKFTIPDSLTRLRFSELTDLAGYSLTVNRRLILSDTYLDTDDRALFRSGYSCRIREKNEDSFITLKSLTSPDGTIHRRAEYESRLSEGDNPMRVVHWPNDKPREIVSRITGQSELQKLFVIRQVRLQRFLLKNDVAVAEMDIDHVIISTERYKREYHELEIELTRDGTEEDLHTISEELMNTWNLEPETASKFQRGLKVLDDSNHSGSLLMDDERKYLETQKLRDDLYGRRATAIFDILSPIHGLAAEYKNLLEIFAQKSILDKNWGTDTAFGAEPDLTLSGLPGDLDHDDHLVISVIENLLKKKITSKRMGKIKKSYLCRLSEFRQREALILASLIRMVEAITTSRISTDDSNISEVKSDSVVINLTGSASIREAKLAESRADLWRLVVGVPISFQGHASAPGKNAGLPIKVPTHPPKRSDKKSEDSPGIVPNDTMAEAARKTLLFHFNRMVLHEPGTREGSDIEELHDMRVATRRMRAAIQTFETEIDSNTIAPYLKDLKRTGRALGSVRDLDVFWERAEKYRSDIPQNRRNELDALKDLWTKERQAAREIMLTYLDGERYARFKESFAALLARENSLARHIDTKIGSTLPRHVSYTVPVILHDRLAAVLAYDGWITKPDASLELFHELRISAKKLRYALEFCSEVLAPECKGLIKELKGLQDHLGDMQDAVVASSVLRNYLKWGTWASPRRKKNKVETPRSPVGESGAAMYLVHMQNLLKQRMKSFPEVWKGIRSPVFAHRLAGSLVPLRVQND